MGYPVLKINDHATGGRRTKDILGGPKGWGPKKKVANVEIYVIFEVFAFCGGRTKTDFKDRGMAGLSQASAYLYYIRGMSAEGSKIPRREHLQRGASLIRLTE